MTFQHKNFDVTVQREIDPRLVLLPMPDAVEDGCCPGGNRDYWDLRGLSWDDARGVMEIEAEYILRIEQAAPMEDAEELFDVEELVEIMGVDIGVASTVAALSASGFIPCASCNGGAFGGTHHEVYPLVAFYAYPQSVPLLLQCAEESGVGLHNDQGWSPDDLPIVVYADSIKKMRMFAEALMKISSALCY